MRTLLSHCCEFMHSQPYVLGLGGDEFSNFTLASKPWKMTRSLQQLVTVSETSSGEGLRYDSQSCDCCSSYFEHTGRMPSVSESDASRINCRRTQRGLYFRSENRKLYESQNRGIFRDMFSTRSTLREAATSRRRRHEGVKYITLASIGNFASCNRWLSRPREIILAG
jgi:hypothetical protein